LVSPLLVKGHSFLVPAVPVQDTATLNLIFAANHQISCGRNYAASGLLPELLM